MTLSGEVGQANCENCHHSYLPLSTTDPRRGGLCRRGRGRGGGRPRRGLLGCGPHGRSEDEQRRGHRLLRCQHRLQAGRGGGGRHGHRGGGGGRCGGRGGRRHCHWGRGRHCGGCDDRGRGWKMECVTCVKLKTRFPLPLPISIILLNGTLKQGNQDKHVSSSKPVSHQLAGVA